MKSNSKGITRRIISILLTVCLTVCCVPVRAFALKAERVSDRIYTGEKVTLTEKDFRTLLFTGEKNNSEYLASGTDFEVAAYSNNLNTGTARVTLRGLGKYGGTKTITFKIIRRSRQ